MYSGYTAPLEAQFTPEARLRIINRESQCGQRQQVIHDAASKAWKIGLPQNDFVAQCVDRHESECAFCIVEASIQAMRQ